MSNQINLKTKSIVELKAFAYDLSAVIQQYQGMLQATNQEIATRAQEEQQKQVNEEQQEAKPVLKKVPKESVTEIAAEN